MESNTSTSMTNPAEHNQYANNLIIWYVTYLSGSIDEIELHEPAQNSSTFESLPGRNLELI